MTSKNQQDVVKYFKRGDCRLLIATSVAEEGLDIKACNCVFRYNYSTNEIGRVQSKGGCHKLILRQLVIFGRFLATVGTY